ncbi:MAG: hypothetical protein V7636_605 [Actinomycetota bacterium]
MPAQHAELVRDVVRASEEVACVGVLRNEPQRLLLATAADEDARTRRSDGPRPAQRLGQSVVLALIGAVVVAPQLEADLQRLLEALEALGRRREGHTQPEVLALVPGGADAELGASA